MSSSGVKFLCSCLLLIAQSKICYGQWNDENHWRSSDASSPQFCSQKSKNLQMYNNDEEDVPILSLDLNFGNYEDRNCRQTSDPNKNVLSSTYNTFEPIQKLLEEEDNEENANINNKLFYMVGEQLAPLKPEEPSRHEFVVDDIFDQPHENAGSHYDSESFDLSDKTKLLNNFPSTFSVEQSQTLKVGPEGIEKINKKFFGDKMEQVHEILVHTIKNSEGAYDKELNDDEDDIEENEKFEFRRHDQNSTKLDEESKSTTNTSKGEER